MDCTPGEHCNNCGLNREALGNNVTGHVIQVYEDGKIWKDASIIYPNKCIPMKLIDEMPKDGIEHRVYFSFKESRV